MREESSSTTLATPSKRRHWGSTLLWVSPLLFLFIFLGYGVLTRPPAVPGDASPRIGLPLPDFTLPDLQGNQVQLAALQVKVVFINIWATWCPPCVEEMPTIQQLYEQLHGHGLEVLAISIDAVAFLIKTTSLLSLHCCPLRYANEIIDRYAQRLGQATHNIDARILS